MQSSIEPMISPLLFMHISESDLVIIVIMCAPCADLEQPRNHFIFKIITYDLYQLLKHTVIKFISRFGL